MSIYSRTKVGAHAEDFMKTSSSRKKASRKSFDIRTTIVCGWLLPQSVELHDEAGVSLVSGDLGELVEARRWKQPPHVRLANLPASTQCAQEVQQLIDGRALAQFITQYGVPNESLSLFEPNEDEDSRFIDMSRFGIPRAKIVQPPGTPNKTRFVVNSSGVSHAQNLLRKAWKGEASSIADIERILSGAPEPEVERELIEAAKAQEHGPVNIMPPFPPRPLVVSVNRFGAFELVADVLWSFIRLLFLRDYGAGRIGVCLNPDCPVPYFVKSRRTQTICEKGDCVAWAQRQHALRWWRTHRAKKPLKPRRG